MIEKRKIERRENTWRLCFVGNMLGRNQGFVTTQGQILADLFAAEGYAVSSVSAKPNRVARLFDVVQYLTQNARKIDVIVLEVYSGHYLWLADAASRLANFYGIPLISVLHGGNLPKVTASQPNRVTGILKRAKILVAPSTYLAEAMEKFGLKVRVIPNVLELEKYPFRRREAIAPRLFWMRSFHPLYNPHLAVKVLMLLRQSYPSASLVMAGRDKGSEQEIKELATANDLGNAVRFTGFLDFEDKIREFSQADIFINTNKIDNMPVSILEAAAMGLPIVATNVGGISRLLNNGETGLLVADDDAEAMARAVKKLLVEPKSVRQLSDNGRKLAEQSNWKAVKNEWENLFEEIGEKP